METEKFKLKDIFWGLILPVIIGLLIIAFPLFLSKAVSGIIPFPLGQAGSEIIITFAIPLFMGLLWNKWAGGITGFILGTSYYLASAGYNYVLNMALYGSLATTGTANYATDVYILQTNMWGDITQLGFIITAMLVGYIAGALLNGSFNFKRMLGASLTAAFAAGIIKFYLQTTSPMVTDYPYVLFTTMLPIVIFAFLIPVIAKVFTWYGIQPTRH